MKSHRLIGNFKGLWSRRINDKERLIYKIDEGAIYRQHYTDH
ncbi:MAG: type II toxin-antitoxin system YoeB family toxin [Holdemanella porci]